MLRAPTTVRIGSVPCLDSSYCNTVSYDDSVTVVAWAGTTTVSVPSASYRTVADQVTAIQGAAGYASLLFTVSQAANGGVPAVYRATATAVETKTLVVSDGTTTVNIASATYTTVADQVTVV